MLRHLTGMILKFVYRKWAGNSRIFEDNVQAKPVRKYRTVSIPILLEVRKSYLKAYLFVVAEGILRDNIPLRVKHTKYNKSVTCRYIIHIIMPS